MNAIIGDVGRKLQSSKRCPNTMGEGLQGESPKIALAVEKIYTGVLSTAVAVASSRTLSQHI